MKRALVLVLAALFAGGIVHTADAQAAACGHTELTGQWVDPDFSAPGEGGTGFLNGDFQCNVRYRVVTETQESTTSQTSGFSQISNNIYYPSATGQYSAGVEKMIHAPIITYWDQGDWNAGLDPDPMCAATKWFRTKAVFRDEDHGNVLIVTSFSTAVTC